jgi:hypothetical protein
MEEAGIEDQKLGRPVHESRIGSHHRNICHNWPSKTPIFETFRSKFVGPGRRINKFSSIVIQ